MEFTQLIDLWLVVLPFLGTAVLGAWAVGHCSKHGMVVGVSERSSHVVPTPTGGGIALVAVIALGWAVLLAFFPLPQKDFLVALLVWSLPVALMGWWDDKYNLPILQRMAVYGVAVAGALCFLPQLFDFVPVWVEKPILFLAWVWFVNLYNFIDGIDGYATSQTAFMGLAIALVVPSLKPLALVVMASALGFLRVNWMPAKIFMGDVGSTFLGFIIGGLLLVGVADNTWEAAFTLFTLTLVISADTTWTLFRRLRRGEPVMQPHKTFWFHRAVKLGFSHAEVARRQIGLNILLLLAAGIGVLSGLPALSLLLGLIVVGFAGYTLAQYEKA